MTELSLAELEDEPGRVYLIGVSADIPPSVREWLHRPKDEPGFAADWHNSFRHAEFVIVPGFFEDVGVIEIEDLAELDDIEVPEPDDDFDEEPPTLLDKIRSKI